MDRNLAFNHRPIDLCPLGCDLQYLYVNDGLAQVNGKPVENHIGQTINVNIAENASYLGPALGNDIDTGETVIGGDVTALPPARAGSRDVDSQRDERDGHDMICGAPDFMRTLERVANIVEQKKAIGEETNPPEILAALGAEKFAELLEMYEIGLSKQCRHLRNEIAAFMEKPENHECRDRIKNLFHSLKGGGGVMGYHLITTIATDANVLLQGDAALDADTLQFIVNSSDALSLVSDKKISGSGGQAGRILLDALKAVA